MSIILLPGAELLLTELTNLRRESGISQAELGRRMEISEQSIRNWENKYTIPNLNRLVQWAEILGYEFDLHPIEKRRSRYV